jgi:SAM-dependent methyltransferase
MESDICAVTCIFNPFGFKSKISNFEIFKQSLESAIKLYVIECVFDEEPFHLAHVPNHIGVRSSAKLWQKERLINYSLRSIPESYTKIAWLDADIIFLNKNWHNEASELLNTFDVVQLFERAVRLPKGLTSYQGIGDAYESFGYCYSRDRSCIKLGTFKAHGHTGFAWAARRSIISKIGLYDACIAGSADHVMVHGMCGETNSPCVDRLLGKDTPLRLHFEEWAKKAASLVSGNIGFVTGEILHLWHGDKKDRRHIIRNQELLDFYFDPITDIRIDDCGSWVWASHKPNLHAWARHYFENRKEDDNIPSSVAISSEQIQLLPFRARGLSNLKHLLGPLANRLQNFLDELLSDKVSVRDPVIIVEIGCGFGQLLVDLFVILGERAVLHGINHKSTHGDGNTAVNVAKFRRIEMDSCSFLSKVKFHFLDASKGIPLADSSVDLLVSQMAICHASHKLEIIKEAHRVLAPGGLALLHLERNEDVIKSRMPRTILLLDEFGRQIDLEQVLNRHTELKLHLLTNDIFVQISREESRDEYRVLDLDVRLLGTKMLEELGIGDYGRRSTYELKSTIV